ncbi:hypothetical protein K7X08_015202 [Anisodus acutangulus]|uniref:Peptidyl-prolyl cis-trans isomerase CYP38-like PsbQ-like domain-containing protein n=1 Tax=Anisodus acutangulus TaxID=402998 RepID=A0A9Q1L303_9SOLA|nr:hypothetical protein K7X08_015202 [Anisodus acutangulus]
MKQFQSLMAVIVIFIEITSPIPLYGWQAWSIYPAEAVLYSPETKTLPRTGELALRRAIPANTNMKAIQDSLEDISYLLRIPQRKPFGTMEGNVKKALKSGLQKLLQHIKDKDTVGLASTLDTVAQLELLLAPGLSVLLPQQYLKYPRLTGRGIVEFTVEKVDGSTFSPEAAGEAESTAKIQVC